MAGLTSPTRRGQRWRRTPCPGIAPGRFGVMEAELARRINGHLSRSLTDDADRRSAGGPA